MNIKYCKSSSWQALRKHLSFTFFRQQITLSRAVLRLDRGQSLWDSYLFQGCHFSGFPTKQASPLLPITTSSSNHRVQGCWGPWLNAQLLISAHSSRPCSSWSSKARNWPRRKGSSKHQVQFSVPLFLGSKLRWFCFFFFFLLPVPWDCQKLWSTSQLLTLCSWGETIMLELLVVVVGAQWLKPMLYRYEDWSLDPQNPHKSQMAMAPPPQ